MTTKRRPKPTPVTPEFRTQAHTLLDQMLDDHPGTCSVLVAVDGGELNAASLPHAMSTIRGMVLSLAEMIEGEKLT
jgi:hypothetical protein